MFEWADEEQLLKQFFAVVCGFEHDNEGQMSEEKAERTKVITMPPKEDQERQETTWDFNWFDISEDVKAEILCSLPLKDLTRLKSVSRDWNLFISIFCAPMLSAPSPRASLIGFIAETPSKQSSNSLHIIPYKGTCKISTLPFQPEPTQLKDSCNGLLLFHRRISKASDSEYYVCNPTTGEYVQVLGISPQDSFDFTCLAFDPLVSPTSFKIIRRGSFTWRPCLEIFSSETGKWRSHLVCTERDFYCAHRSLYWNGTLYLMMPYVKHLLCFGISSAGDDPDNITCRIVPLPGKDRYKHCGSFGAVKGCVVYSNADAREIRVWRLSETEGDSWIIKHTIGVGELCARNIKKRNPEAVVKVYAFLPHSEELVVGTPELVHIYDPTTKVMELLYRSKRRFVIRGQHRLFPCFTCAVTLKGRRFICK